MWNVYLNEILRRAVSSIQYVHKKDVDVDCKLFFTDGIFSRFSRKLAEKDRKSYVVFDVDHRSLREMSKIITKFR